MNVLSAIPNGLKHIWIWLVEDTIWCEGIDVYLESIEEMIGWKDNFNLFGKLTLYLICFLFGFLFCSIVFIFWTGLCIPFAIICYTIVGLLKLGELLFIKKTKR